METTDDFFDPCPHDEIVPQHYNEGGLPVVRCKECEQLFTDDDGALTAV